MPLSTDDIGSIRRWFRQHPGRQAIRRGPADQTQFGAACFRWAVSGLKGGQKEPPDLLDTILFNGSILELGPTVKEIHDTFGYFDHYRIKVFFHTNAQQRLDAVPALHRLTSNVFEYCLRKNGFTQVGHSDYKVCMEYEMSPRQAMYPNFTHAWLAYRDLFVVQTIPGCHLSISQTEAGRQPHCGIIRRSVQDFLPEQIKAIEGIIRDPVVGTTDLVNCGIEMGTDHDAYPPSDAEVLMAEAHA